MGWDINSIHTIGMNALYDGYIVKVLDIENRTLWDAEECDMSACRNIMRDISLRMRQKYPQMNGEFTVRDFPLSHSGADVGTARISYFGPYFLSDNDFNFLSALNVVSVSVGIVCLILSIAVGLYMSKRISDPISKAARAAHRMSNGDYTARIDSKHNTVELEELVDSINQLSTTLSYQESLRKQFTADVSHELRTPLTSIQTHLEAMMEGIWEPTPERLESCHEEASRIGTLVKDLEALARIENENVTLRKTRVSLHQIWCKAIDGFELELQNKGLSVTLEGEASEFWADEDRLGQVAVNLLSNAIKYTPKGGHIAVTLSQAKKHAVFFVDDDGIGIPEQELPFIFERFYRADKSRNRKTGGAGIGLAVVKSIVTAHGGEIKVKNLPERGSRFVVMLPVSE
jgi:signal transduction histidine kinase